jgi:hypothetical protein
MILKRGYDQDDLEWEPEYLQSPAAYIAAISSLLHFGAKPSELRSS